MKKINFREYKTTSGKKVLGGKSASNNEELIKQVKDNEYVLHTAKPGSPFVNIKLKKKGNKNERVNKQDIYEAGVFCSVYSQAWKKSKKKGDVEVHVFKGKEVYKDKGMKTGTFGVKKKKEIIIKKKDIENMEKEIRK